MANSCFTRGVWGHAPPEKFWDLGFSRFNLRPTEDLSIYMMYMFILYVLVISPLGVMLLVYRPDIRGPINCNITTKR